MGHRAAILAAVGLFACTVDSSAEQAESTDSSIVSKVLADSAEVHADRLVFPKNAFPSDLRARLDAHEANVILASDRQSNAVDASGKVREGVANPYGFLRRAVSYRDEGDKTIVLTEQASLDEAFENLHSLGRSASTLHFVVPVVDVADKELYSEQGLTVRARHGFVTLDTTIDLGADIGFFKLNDAHVITDALIKSGLEIEANLDGSFEKKFEKEVFRGSWPIGSIGPIPVTLGLGVNIGCEISSNGRMQASSGVTIDTTIRGGVSYEKSAGTKPIFAKPEVTPSLITPTIAGHGTGTPRCFLRPQLEVLLFDVAGPFVAPELSATLKVNGPPVAASLDGGLALDIGGQLRIFGKDLGAIDYRVYSIEKELWKSN
jgi:hypothetical protein